MHRLEVPWGEIFPLEMLAEAVERHPKAKALGIVHAETSTGALQPLEGLAEILHEAGMLFIVDAVTSLAGHPLKVDAWGIDAIYSGTQKCLSCPPGLSPVSFSPRAVEVTETAQDQGAELVFRHLDAQGLLQGQWQAGLSPHRADEHDLRAARGA